MSEQAGGAETMSEKGLPLADRMKGYEMAFTQMLPLRLPVVLRVDGKAFHAWTRGLQRPFDAGFMAAMDAVAIRLCEEAQGARLAYVQSDEISILLHNYQRLNSSAWFDNGLQKLVSVAASMASAEMTLQSSVVHGAIRAAHFDARAFVLPEAEVCNYFLWRQQDATRNSIQMLARSLYSHGACHGKNTSEMQEMCFAKGCNWNDLPTAQRRGRCAVHGPKQGERWAWRIDPEIPKFSEDRTYVERYLATDEG